MLRHEDTVTNDTHYDQALAGQAVVAYQETIRRKGGKLTRRRMKHQSNALSKRSA